MTEYLPAFLVEYSDSSFTNPHEVVLPDEPKECTGNFTHMGAKYWGFETLRHRAMTRTKQGFQFDDEAAHDFVIGLKHHSMVEEIRVSTKWFTGNQVPSISIELIDGESVVVVVDRATLDPDADHVFKIEKLKATRCRVLCYHEGGISRVNLFGEMGDALYEQPNLLETAEISFVSNDHYGSPAMAVAGNRSEDHMIGWESARSGFGEQCVFSFPQPIVPEVMVVDTYLHRLNPPLSCHVYGLAGVELEAAMKQTPRWCLKFEDGTEVQPDDIQRYIKERLFLKEPVANPAKFEVMLKTPAESPWQPLVSFADLRPDAWHELKLEMQQPVSHLLYTHFPNGGVHGLKVFGRG